MLADESEEDYYGFFNIPKNASNEEISNSYKRLSLMYHPDKHVDVKHKKWAETIFNKTKKIYEVLSDPQKRSIYDALGCKGLDTNWWKVVERPVSYFHICDEYERLVQDINDQKLYKRINPMGIVSVSINATDIFNHYYSDYRKKEVSNFFPTIEISSLNIAHSIEAPVSLRDTVTISSNIWTHNGLGSGVVNISSQRMLPGKGWGAIDFGFGSGPTFGFRTFHSLPQSIFFNGSGGVQFSTQGIRPSIASTFSMNMDQNTVGYLTYKGGLSSSMTTTLMHSTDNYNGNISVQFGVSNSFISASYSRRILNRELKIYASIKLGTFGFLVEYGLEKRISTQSNLSGTVMIGVPTGIILKVCLTRERHSFVFPIHICEEILMAPIFYATVLPVVSWLTVRHFIIDPINERKLKRKCDKMKEKHNSKIKDMQKEAFWTVSLMREMYSRLKTDEERVNGLIIIKAVYGKCVVINNFSADNDRLVINVTVPLQCLIKNSTLTLQGTSKAYLPGFYDPCLGELKYLTIEYTFQNQRYTCIVKDNEAITLPQIMD